MFKIIAVDSIIISLYKYTHIQKIFINPFMQRATGLALRTTKPDKKRVKQGACMRANKKVRVD